DEYLTYAQQVRKNAQALAQFFVHRDYKNISGGTDNHLKLVDLRNKDIAGKEAEAELGKAGITTNKSMVRFARRAPFVTSVDRFGTTAITTSSLGENEIMQVGALIDAALTNRASEAAFNAIHEKVMALMAQFPVYE